MRYRYEISGTAAGEQTWTTQGFIETEKMGDFPEVPTKAIGAAFFQLTKGQAVFGQPGVACRGPYGITRMVIQRQNEAHHAAS